MTPLVEVSARSGRWTVHADGFWFDLEREGGAREGLTVGGTAVAAGDVVDTRLRFGSVGVGVGWRVYELDLDYAGRPSEATPYNTPGDGVFVGLDAVVGLRGYAVDLEIEDGAGGELVSANDVWVDPVVGGRLLMDLPGGLGFGVLGEVGGFGVGSEFACGVRAAFDYEVTSWATAQVGYRFMAVDRELGDGVRFDAGLAGLFGGLSFRY